MMLEEKLRELRKNNMEVCLLYKGNLDGLVVTVTWKDPKHCYTLKTERLIKFSDLREPPIPVGIDSTFESNLSNILGNMAVKVLERAERYTHSRGENDVQNHHNSD